MKNILRKVDFLNIKNNKINESLDFSNRTGFSESLLGRGINKLFSFIAKNAHEMVLNKIIKNMEDQYLKSIFITLSMYDKELKEGKNNIPGVEIKLQNKKSGKVISSYISDEENKELIFKLPNDTTLEQYKTLITSVEYNSTWTIYKNSSLNEKMGTELDPLIEQFYIEIISESGESKLVVRVVVGEVISNDNNLTILYLNDDKKDEPIYLNDKDVNIDNKTKTIRVDYDENLENLDVHCVVAHNKANIITESNTKVKDYKFPSKDAIVEKSIIVEAENGDKATWTIIINIKSKELSKTIVSKTIASKTKDGDVVEDVYLNTIKEYIENFDENCLKNGDYSLLNYTTNKIKTELELWNKFMQLNKDEKFQKFYETLSGYHKKLDEFIPIEHKKSDVSEQDINIFINKYKNTNKELISKYKENNLLISGRTTDVVSGDGDVDVKFNKENSQDLIQNVNDINNKYEGGIKNTKSKEDYNKKYNQLISIINDVDNYNPKEIKKVYNEYKEIIRNSGVKVKESLTLLFGDVLNEENKLKTILNKKNKQTISNILSKYIKSDKSGELQSTIKKYENLDINKIDLKELVGKFKSDPNLRKNVIINVNKEALKELAYRAEWIYDTEKYVDKRNQHYSRVNFTVTGADQAKLKSLWLRKISKLKSQYTDFFVDETGMFPQILDPIALIKSDATFRDKFEESISKDPKFTAGGLGSGPSLNVLTEETLKKLKLENVGKLVNNQYGHVIFTPEHNISDDLCMIVEKIEVEGLYLWKFVGLFNFKNINDAIKKDENISDVDMKNIIAKNNYSSTIHIDDNVDDNVKQSVLEAYKYISPTNSEKFKNYFNKTNDSLSTFFVDTQNNTQTPTKFHQINIVVVGKDFYDDKMKKSFITNIDEETNLVTKYTYITDDSSAENISNNKGYIFKLDIKEINQVKDLDFWGLDVFSKLETNKTETFTKKPDLIKFLKKLLTKKN